jgi:hypothetical protein
MTWMCTVVRVLLVGRELGLVAVSHNYVSGKTHHLIKGGYLTSSTVMCKGVIKTLGCRECWWIVCVIYAESHGVCDNKAT